MYPGDDENTLVEESRSKNNLFTTESYPYILNNYGLRISSALPNPIKFLDREIRSDLNSKQEYITLRIQKNDSETWYDLTCYIDR
jgi:hypothetical protein